MLADTQSVLLKCPAWAPPHRYAVVMGGGSHRANRESIWPTEEETRVLIAATRVLGPFVKGLIRGRRMPEDVKCIQEIQRPEVVGDRVEVHAVFPAPPSPNEVRTGRPARGG